MLSGTGDFELALEKQLGAFVDGDTITISEGEIADLLRTIEAGRDAGITGDIPTWGDGWWTMPADGNTIFLPAATWYTGWIFESNDPEGSGRWGFMKQPGGIGSWGGASMGIYKDSENKEAAWKYVEYQTLSMEGTAVLKGINNYVPYKPFYEQSLPADPYAFFGGQDLYKFWTDQFDELQLRPVSPYDATVEGAILAATEQMNIDKTMTTDDAIAMIIEQLEVSLPDAVIK